MHAIQERPVVRDGQVVIRPMMYLALSYDHRIVDGREAVTFLRRVKELIENPARLLWRCSVYDLLVIGAGPGGTWPPSGRPSSG